MESFEMTLASNAIFEDIPLVRPSVPDADELARDVRRIVESGVLTDGPFVARFEAEAARYLNVRHCLAVSSCTAGLMLLLRAADLSNDVVLPSFTFAATAHAVAWNGLRPRFADVDPGSLTMSGETVRRYLGVRTSAILATHLYGTPADVEGLQAIAEEHGIPLFFDAAHAFGSRRKGTPVGGFGDAEVFSLSPTKVIVAGEGGLIATNDDDLAERCRIGRNYGNPGDYDCRFIGLNARMSEFHAAVALRSLEGLDARIERRHELAGAYREALESVAGIGFPTVEDGDRTTYKDFTILVDAETAGLTADELGSTLAAVGIETRRYYSPPVHRTEAYRALPSPPLPVTDAAAARVLTLPMWSEMSEEQVRAVAGAVARICRYVKNGRSRS